MTLKSYSKLDFVEAHDVKIGDIVQDWIFAEEKDRGIVIDTTDQKLYEAKRVLVFWFLECKIGYDWTDAIRIVRLVDA